MGKRERKVENYLTDEVEKLGGITCKWARSNRVGIPDQIIILGGWIPFVEVKTVDGVLSPEQIREHDKLQKHGADVYTVYGHPGVDNWIRWIKINKTNYITQARLLRQSNVDTG